MKDKERVSEWWGERLCTKKGIINEKILKVINNKGKKSLVLLSYVTG